jgi:MFS family permease
LATGTFFFVNGATFASWVPRLPEIRQSLEMSDTVLGLTLVGSGVGGLTMSFLSGVLVDRFGSRTATVATSIVLSCALPLIAVAPAPAILFVVLLAIGGFDGLTDVAMNIQALQLQRTVTQSILNRMHATWSIGTLLGGITASTAAGVGVSLGWHLSVTAAVLVGATLVATPFLLPTEPRFAHETDTEGRRVRPARLLLAGLFGIGVLAVLVEMPATEWSTLMMAERFDISAGLAGLGFIGFTAGMVVGRLSGDILVDRFDPEVVRRSSAALAAVGLLVACTGVVPAVTVVGLFVAGMGGAAMFPMSVRRASDLVPGATGVAMFSAGARLGILLGPPMMGLLSDATSRSTALLLIGGAAAVVTASIRLPASPTRPGPVPDEGFVPHH